MIAGLRIFGLVAMLAAASAVGAAGLVSWAKIDLPVYGFSIETPCDKGEVEIQSSESVL